jgi:Flp pilus assembly protein TadD
MRKAQQHLQQGQRRFQMGDMLGAITELKSAIELNLQDPACYAMLGICYLQVGRANDALSALQQAADLAPNDPEIAYVLGSVLLEASQPERAVQEFQRCVKLDPNGQRGMEAKQLLEELALENGVPAAAAQPAPTPKPQPKSASAELEENLNFARVCLESGLERRARTELAKLVESNPDNVEAWELLAQALEKMGDPTRAQECRQKAEALKA